MFDDGLFSLNWTRRIARFKLEAVTTLGIR